MATWQGIERHYDINKLVSLTGKEFENIRNRLNCFHRYNPSAEVCKYEECDFDKLMELGRHWKDTSGKKYPRLFDKVYYKQLVGHCKELDQIILVIKIDGKIVGMISGSELPTGQAWGSLVKFEEGFPGLSETLIVEFARELKRNNPNIELMNVGSDLGEEGLRKYKLKFRPVLNLKRYQIHFK